MAITGEVDAGIEVFRQRLDDARAQARCGVSRAFKGFANAVVSNRQSPARLVGVIRDDNATVCLGLRERVLQGVDDAFDDDEADADRFAGDDRTAADLGLKRHRARPSPIIDCASAAHSFVR